MEGQFFIPGAGQATQTIHNYRIGELVGYCYCRKAVSVRLTQREAQTTIHRFPVLCEISRSEFYLRRLLNILITSIFLLYVAWIVTIRVYERLTVIFTDPLDFSISFSDVLNV